jgi:hypothetical protein
MKTKELIWIVSLTYLLILFPINLRSQDVYVAEAELVVFKQADFKSDTTCIIHINDKVEVVEIKKVWLKKWAKIQNIKGILGYVQFNKLKPIDANQYIQEKNNEEPTTNNNGLNEVNTETQYINTNDLDKQSLNIPDKNRQENLKDNNENLEEKVNSNIKKQHEQNSYSNDKESNKYNDDSNISSPQYTDNEKILIWSEILFCVIFIMITSYRFKRRCDNCKKWNAMRIFNRECVDQKQSTIVEKRSMKNRKGEVIRSWEVDIPATTYYYRIHRKCKHCGYKDYLSTSITVKN